jgi:hypothetical protein
VFLWRQQPGVEAHTFTAKRSPLAPPYVCVCGGGLLVNAFTQDLLRKVFAHYFHLTLSLRLPHVRVCMYTWMCADGLT